MSAQAACQPPPARNSTFSAPGSGGQGFGQRERGRLPTRGAQFRYGHAYAADHVQAGNWDPDQAETLAALQVDDLLPSGPQTAGMLLLAAESADGEQVGLVWISLNRSRPGNAWIYDIQISLEHQGNGYGRVLLQAAEEQALLHGFSTIGLHVFGANTVARNLYESSGYQAASLVVRKPLSGTAAAEI